MPKLKVSSIWYQVSGIKNTKYKILNTKYCKSAGFTLIELLIVISIIGILATLTLASYSGAQAKARDGVRKSDLAQIKRALELVKSDCAGNAWYPYITDAQIQTGSNLSLYLLQGGTSPYMNPVPKDPQNGGTQIYAYTPDTTAGNFTAAPAVAPCPGADGSANAQHGTKNYTLSVKLERANDQAGSESRITCNGKPGVPAAGSYVTGFYYVCNN